jgi:hypothetical protein
MGDELLPGVEAWNAAEFAEAADRFEEVWVGEVGARRACLRGVIHAAMGLHYVVAHDVDAALSKLSTAARLLAPLPADVLGLDLGGLRSAIGAIQVRLAAVRERGDPSGVLGAEILPRLCVVAAAEQPRDCSRPCGN